MTVVNWLRDLTWAWRTAVFYIATSEAKKSRVAIKLSRRKIITARKGEKESYKNTCFTIRSVGILQRHFFSFVINRKVSRCSGLFMFSRLKKYHHTKELWKIIIDFFSKTPIKTIEITWNFHTILIHVLMYNASVTITSYAFLTLLNSFCM